MLWILDMRPFLESIGAVLSRGALVKQPQKAHRIILGALVEEDSLSCLSYGPMKGLILDPWPPVDQGSEQRAEVPRSCSRRWVGSEDTEMVVTW